MAIADQDEAQHVGFGIGEFVEAQDALRFASAADIAGDDDRRFGRAMREQDRRSLGQAGRASR
jgi:hypothetical protein